MEYKVELIPHVGVVLDGKTVRLGATRADVERLLGEPMGEEDIAYETRRTHWAAIGVGVENYYQ